MTITGRLHVAGTLRNSTFLSREAYRKAEDFIHVLKKQASSVKDKVPACTMAHGNISRNSDALKTFTDLWNGKLSHCQRNALTIMTSYISGSAMLEEVNRSRQLPHAQLRMLLTGEAGVGKSHVVKLITMFTKLSFPDQGNLYGPILLCAPYSIAAHAIQGRTVHSVFGIHAIKKQGLAGITSRLRSFQDQLAETCQGHCH
jgi:hypothetical protein